MIRAENLTIIQPEEDQPLIRNASFTIDEGDLCLVIGATGTGKSTLLGAFNGLVPHVTGATMGGDVTVTGRNTRQHRPRDMAEVVGYVGQNPAASFVTEIVEDEVAYGMEQLGLAPSIMRKRVEETIDLMGIADLRSRRVHQLSGGQQQRVAIAAVLAAQPRVLLLDEPTSALDPNAAQDVLAAITTLVHDVGLTVVLVEHRLERVMQAADSALWLPGDGRIVSGDAPSVLAQADAMPPLVALARHLRWPSVPLSVREARRRVEANTRFQLPVAPELGEALSWDAGGATAVVKVNDLTVRYGDLRAVNDVSLQLEAGTAVSVMGRNGSGKSSLLWALQGAVPSSGTLRVAGQDPRKVDDATARSLVSLVPQTPADLLYLPTVGDECAQADQESNVPSGTTADLLRQLGQPLPPERNPRDLSEGQRLALVLAIQLAASPRVVCLDEPTRGHDYVVKTHLSRIVDHLVSTGVCVVIATHDVEFAAQTTDRSIVLAEGEVVADGTTRQVCTSSPSYAPQMAKVFYPADVMTIDDLRGDLG